jgi:hypothetical protein
MEMMRQFVPMNTSHPDERASKITKNKKNIKNEGRSQWLIENKGKTK